MSGHAASGRQPIAAGASGTGKEAEMNKSLRRGTQYSRRTVLGGNMVHSGLIVVVKAGVPTVLQTIKE
jgi:hypothetical protein